jgi:outer membrane murein-binding lipoprotein Lpp
MSNINEVAADLFAINAQIKALTEQADALKATVKANGSFTCDQYEVKGNYLISHHD